MVRLGDLSMVVLILMVCMWTGLGAQPNHGAVDTDNNEFAEFEDMDDVIEREEEHAEEPVPLSAPPIELEDTTTKAPATVEDDDDEFLVDDDEFEGAERKPNAEKGESQTPQPLKFADVPAHFRSNWASYQVEAIVLLLLGLYMVNYIVGRSRNQAIAYTWFSDVNSLLHEQFSVVGDDGTSEEPTDGQLIKETDSSYSIWCSGRAGCQSMLIQLKLQKRQDLISVITGIARPKQDKAIIRIDMDQNEMDTFVVAFGQRKSVTKAVKDVTDLNVFTVERKGVERMGLPASMAVFAEMSEAAAAIIDPTVQSIVRRYETAIDYFHFSDQYSGLKPPEGETYTRLPDTSRVLIFGINISNDGAETEALMRTVFHCLEKIRRYRLSREGKMKADKKRLSVQEAFLKTTHQARQEAAQARREEKTRERKQRLLEEEDPEKQRRLEKLEQKRDSKQRQPKMKQLKLK